VVIRSFRWSDLDSVLNLWGTAGPGIHLGPSDTPDEIRRKLSRDPDLFLVAEDRGEIVGSVLGGYDGRRAIVYHLAVRPSARRAGWGTALMDELEQRLRALGCFKSYLLVAVDNPEAVEFYQHRGWNVMDHILMGKEFR
jgi:ribosomal protein S18 acetylase RimI-like enzyme